MYLQDILLALTIGDAFGAGVEFQDRNWIKSNVDFTNFVNARHLIQLDNFDNSLFTENYLPWDYTDDTEMTIGLIKALMAQEEFSKDLLVKFWKQEYQEGIQKKSYGRNGHGSMRWVYEGSKTIEEVRNFQQNRPYPGNAPASRAVPLGLLSQELITPYAIINADATHPHPIARASSVVVAQATAFMLSPQNNPNSIIPFCQHHIQNIDQETFDLLSKVDQLSPPEELNHQDYEILCGPQPIKTPRFPGGILGLPSDALHTTACTLYTLKFARNTFDGLKYAIQMGGDVDSLASICTGILAGRFGIETLPDFMLHMVEGKTYLMKIAQEFKNFISEKTS